MGSEGGCIHCGPRADCTTEMYGKVWRAGGNESLCIAVSEIKIGMIVRRVALELLDFGSNGVVKILLYICRKTHRFPRDDPSVDALLNNIFWRAYI